MQVFKAKDQSYYFWIEHWKALLDTCQLLGPHAIAPAEARLIFCWSQMLVRDELKKRQRAISLLSFDFVEVRNICTDPTCDLRCNLEFGNITV